MGSKIESGHAVNVSNFFKLIQKCDNLTGWNPSNDSLKIAEMTTFHTDSQTLLNAFNTAVMAAKTPIADNTALFDPLSKLVTRIVNYYDSTNAKEQSKKNARTLANDLRGFNAKKPKGTAPDAEWVSSSHQSFVQKANKFKEIIEFLNADSQYNPNETELKIAELTTLWTSLDSSIKDLATVMAPLDQAKASLYRKIYAKENGLITIALLAKRYAKALKGAQAIEIKEIMAIAFRRISSKLIVY
jgi:hypothetical protein